MAKTTERPIGFGAWTEEMTGYSGSEKAKELEVTDLEEVYEEKCTKYLSFVNDLTKQIADLTGKYLYEKSRRMYQDMLAIELQQDIEKLKKEIEELKSQKSEE